MSQARQYIIEEIAKSECVDYCTAESACEWCTNVTMLGLIAQQIRARRIGIFELRLRVAPWVDRKTLDAESLSAVLAVAKEGLPLLAGAVAMVTGWE